MHFNKLLLQGFNGAKKVSSFQINLMRCSVDDRDLLGLVFGDADHGGSPKHKLGPGVVDRGDVCGFFVPVASEFGLDDGG